MPPLDSLSGRTVGVLGLLAVLCVAGALALTPIGPATQASSGAIGPDAAGPELAVTTAAPATETNDTGLVLDDTDRPTSPSEPSQPSSAEALTTVLVVASDDAAVNISAIESLDAEVGSRHGRYLEVTASAQRIETIRNLDWVESVRPTTSSEPLSTSEGVDAIAADQLHQVGVTGEAVKVGVLTGGVEPGSPEYAGQIAAAKSFHSAGIRGDDSTHGTGVTEIVADTAPGAELYLTSFETGVDYANAVSWLRDNDVDVIVMSRAFFRQPGTGDGFASQIAQETAANGIFWANSAGNAAEKHWQSSFVDSDGDGWLNFEGEYEANPLGDGRSFSAGERVRLNLQWDEYPETTADYTIALIDATGEVVAASARYGGASTYPAERLSVQIPRDGRYYFGIYGSDSDHAVEVFGSDNTAPFGYSVPESSIRAPAVAEGVTAVGAFNVNDGALASYSSWGPTNDGRRGLDVLGPSTVSTRAYDGRFSGTSAAAPHIGGAAALLLEVNPEATRAELEQALGESATDLGPTGMDISSGAGRANLPGAAEQVDPAVPLRLTTNTTRPTTGEWVSVTVSRADTNTPVNATLTIDQGVVTTGTDGTAAVSFDAPGTYTVTASSVTDPLTADYLDQSVSLTVESATTAPVDIRTVDPTVSAGGETTVRLQTTAQTSSITIDERFAPAFDRASVDRVLIDGQEANPILAAADQDGAVVLLEGLNQGANVTVEYTVGVSASAPVGSSYSISGNITDSETRRITTDEVTVSKPEVQLGLQANTTTTQVDSPVGLELRREDTNEPVAGELTVIQTSGTADGTPTVVQRVQTAPDGTATVTPTTAGTYQITGAKAETASAVFLNDTLSITATDGQEPEPPQTQVRTLGSSTVEPGGSVEVELRTTAVTQSLTFNESFSPALEDATIQRITVDGESATPLVEAAEAAGLVVVLTGVEPGANVTVVYSVDVASNTSVGTTYQIAGQLTDDGTRVLPTDEFTVEQADQGVIGQYDTNGDGSISIGELGTAAADYANGNLSIAELGEVAAAYANS